MVCAKLALDAVSRSLVGIDSHDAGTIHQDIDLVDAGNDFRCCLAYRRLVGKIELDECSFNFGVDLLDLLDDGRDFGFGAAGEDDLLGIGSCKAIRSFGTNAALAGPGDDD